MKVSKFRAFLILSGNLLNTLRGCLRALIPYFRDKNDHAVISRLVNRWGADMCDAVKMKRKCFIDKDFKIEPGKRYILMGNHTSYYDIPTVFDALPEANIRMMAKKELFMIPIIGRVLKMIGFIPVNRGSKEASKDLKLTKEKLNEGLMIYLAPEGTRSKDGKLQKLKKGGFLLSFQTKANIIPIGIRGAREVLPPGGWDFELGRKVEVHIGAPIDTSNYRIRELPKLMEEVATQIKILSGEIEQESITR